MTATQGRRLVLALTFSGWAVLAYVILALPVTPTAQAVFYAAGFVALAGTGALVFDLYRLRRGGDTDRKMGPVLLLGNGMRLALAVEFSMWLQSLRMLSFAHLALVAGAYLLLEYLFRSADRGARS